MLKLFNTLTKKIEEFKPIKKNSVRVYSCGPTVYDYVHIGNLRTYIFNDVLRRVLTFDGYKVKHIMNITDVGHLTGDSDNGDDKLEKGAKREKKSVWDVAKFYEKEFLNDIRTLNILMPDKLARATDHIKQQIKIIENLVKKILRTTPKRQSILTSQNFLATPNYRDKIWKIKNKPLEQKSSKTLRKKIPPTLRCGLN